MSRRTKVIGAVLAALCLPPGGAAASARYSPGGYGRVEIAPDGNLGRVDSHGDVAAVLQRSTGIVTLVDVADPFHPRVTGEYDDGAVGSLDGDVAFSHDGKFVFYARQSEQFSKDGVLVLDVSDPAKPSLASYQPGGGALRVDTYYDGSTEWVFLLDAVTGFVVYRSVPEAGVLVPVYVDPFPATKVGGPASGGLFVEKRDPQTKTPLLYVTTGKTGLQIFDISDPSEPEQVGAWAGGLGLAEVEVRATATSRMVYAASEYWFYPFVEPVVMVFDAENLRRIGRKMPYSIGAPAQDDARMQGMELVGRKLLVAHSNRYLVSFPGGHVVGPWRPRPCHAPPGGGCLDAFLSGSVADVELAGRNLLVTDSLGGDLYVLQPQVRRTSRSDWGERRR